MHGLRLTLKSSVILVVFTCLYFSRPSHAVGLTENGYPHYYVSDSKENGTPNEMQILHSGIASLQKRIDLIRKAKKRISLEYFIWEEDKAGLLMFHELIKRAKDGVDIRIILDKSITVIEMDEFFSEAVRKYGIDLRHYNRALDPSTAQFRTHRKILVIDGKEGITGGRNIGDDYFDMDEVYNFLDRDVYVKGPVALAMQDSFDDFWNNPIVKKAKVLDSNPNSRRLFRNQRDRQRYHNHKDEVLERRRAEAKQWIEGHTAMAEVSDEVERIARPILNKYPTINCPKVTYVSDRPGANFVQRIQPDYRKDFRVLRKVIFDYIKNQTRGEFILASPYFMLNKYWQEALSEVIKDEKVKMTLYTNSLGSTDAFYVAANFYRIIFKWHDFGLTTWMHNSKFDAIDPVFNEAVEKGRWGMHEKTQVYSDQSFYIGTYNIDNRSDFYNTEMGLFCDGSKELTKNLVDDMKERYLKGYKIVGDEKAVTADGENADVYGDATEKQVKFMKKMTIPSLLLEPLM